MCLQEEREFPEEEQVSEYSKWKDWHRNEKTLSIISQQGVQFGFVKDRAGETIKVFQDE